MKMWKKEWALDSQYVNKNLYLKKILASLFMLYVNFKWLMTLSTDEHLDFHHLS